MTVHLARRQWGQHGPQGAALGAGSGGHRTDGYRAAKRAWVCVCCRAWHDAKPKVCRAPDCSSSGPFLFFGSKGEGLRFMQLWSWQDYGQIIAGTLEQHPRYPLYASGPNGERVKVATYEADAAYTLADGTAVVEDYKPENVESRDPMFKRNRRMFEVNYAPLTITLVHT